MSADTTDNHFDVWHGWGDWMLRTLLVLGMICVANAAYEKKPWRGFIVGFSEAQAEAQPEENPIDERDIAPRFKAAPKPYAWAEKH